jgi:hypothetical protein
MILPFTLEILMKYVLVFEYYVATTTCNTSVVEGMGKLGTLG